MQSLKKILPFLLLPVALLPLAGCGGGGTDATSFGVTNATGRAALNVYVTDGFSDQYKQVLVTLYKIELTADGTTYQTVFTDDKGQTLDLASLASTAQLLASVTVPTGTYTKARITFGTTVTLVSADSTSKTVTVDSSLGTVTGNQIAVTVNTPARVLSNQSNSVLVDFKLAEFRLVGNLLRPSIACGNGDGPGGFGGKHRDGHLSGTVSNLSETGFTLTTRSGSTITVATNTATVITSGQTGKTATLANGQSVLVEGTVNATTGAVTATSVTLNDYTTFARERARGTVASVDTANTRFVLTVQRADGIQPTAGTIIVSTNTATLFAKGRHATGSLTDVTTGSSVDVEGTFDATTQTLSARTVFLRPTTTTTASQ